MRVCGHMISSHRRTVSGRAKGINVEKQLVLEENSQVVLIKRRRLDSSARSGFCTPINQHSKLWSSGAGL